MSRSIKEKQVKREAEKTDANGLFLSYKFTLLQSESDENG